MTIDAVLICISSLFLAVGTYIVWPSRWNIPAHLALGFWFVSFLIPVALVGTYRSFDPRVVGLLAKAMTLGAFAFGVGILAGQVLMQPTRRGIFTRIATGGDIYRRSSAKAVAVAACAAILLLIYCIHRMGFIPMFAADPFAAKFFRGSYGVAYRPVATYYRAATSVLSLVLPLVAAYALTGKRRWAWRAIGAIALMLLVTTLQRGPAVSGLLLFAGVWFAARRQAKVFVIGVIGVYVGGTLFYAVLETLGILAGDTPNHDTSWLQTVAATAPDVSDALTFLTRWIGVGEPLTHGHTFVGGLVPGNYRWNPAVWSLTLGSQGIDVSQIRSGGLRLPLPIWGYTAFGWDGVLLVPFVSGILAGGLATRARHALQGSVDLVSRTWVLVFYQAATAVLPGFATVDYLDAFKLLALFVLAAPLVFRAARPPNERVSSVSRERNSVGGVGDP